MYKIEKIELIREIDGKPQHTWNMLVDHVANNLEAYRKGIREKFKATRVLLTFTETDEFQNQKQN